MQYKITSIRIATMNMRLKIEKKDCLFVAAQSTESFESLNIFVVDLCQK